MDVTRAGRVATVLISGEIAVQFLSVEAANERHNACFKDETDTVVTQTNAVILAVRFQPFEVGNFPERPCRFDLFEDPLDPVKQGRILDYRQIRLEGLAEGRVHAIRVRRRKIFLRVVRRDFSP